MEFTRKHAIISTVVIVIFAVIAYKYFYYNCATNEVAK